MAGSINSRQDTPSDYITNLIAAGIQKVGLKPDERSAYQRAKQFTNLLDFTPLGIPQAGFDAGQMMGAGANNRSLGQMALGAGVAGLALVPDASRAVRALKDIRPPTDNLHTVLRSNFNNAKVVGDEMVPIDRLLGGTTGSPSEKRKVENLAQSMSGPDGYFSRIIADQDGNVIEGQHRLDAARQLGMTHVPIVRVRDTEAGLPVADMKAAMDAAGPIRSEHANQLIGHIGDLYGTEGSAKAVLENYDPPAGFAKHWAAALGAIDK